MIVVLLFLKLLGLLFFSYSVSGPPSVAALCIFGTRGTD